VRALAVVLTFVAVGLPVLVGCGENGENRPAGAPNATGSRPEAASGEKSVEGFGDEAAGQTRAALLQTFKTYLGAIGGHAYRTACAQLSATVRESLAQLTNGRPTYSDCARALSALFSAETEAIDRRQARGTITKVRVKADRAFVVFHAPGAKLYMMALVREGADWKASSASTSILVPAASTFGR